MAIHFDIDKMKADFEPVRIVFRGKEYALGREALGLLNACEMHVGIEDKDGIAYVKALMEMLPELLRSVCPEMTWEGKLETGEQMALTKACTEVLGRIGRLTFQAEGPEGDEQEADR